MHLDMTKRGLWVLALALALGVGCGETADPEAERQAEAAQRVEALEAQKEVLDAKRDRLAELRAMEAEPTEDAAEPTEGEEGAEAEAEGADEAMTAEEIEAEIQQLEGQISAEAQELYTKVVEAFNANPPNQGEPLTEVQKRTVRLKSDEDILVAREYIDKGGNYEKAIQIYQDALKIDPGYARLQEALEQAEATRYMDEERFSQVEKGMTDDEVADLLGTPFYRNVNKTDDGLTLWLYPKSERRDAVGIWFRGEGEDLTVTAMDYDAVAGRSAEGEGDEEG